MEIIIDLPIGFPINNIISLLFRTILIQATWFVGDSFQHFFIYAPPAWPLPFRLTGISRKRQVPGDRT